MIGVLAGLAWGAVVAGGAGAAPREQLDAYTATVTHAQVEELKALGVDLHEAGAKPFARAKVPLVLTRTQARELGQKGIRTRVQRVGGLTSSQRSRRLAAAGYTVYRSYSEPGGIEDELRMLARRHRNIARLVKIGESVQGQPILAVRVTRNPRRTPQGSRPAVLYVATQHAREWIATETNRRLLRYFLENYATNSTVRNLVNTRELWFVPVANPDGYDYTFTPGNRLWRKNLRDNNGDGKIEAGVDGVDLNRNFATNWGYDNEGSSPDPGDETYRGPRPHSEPETAAMDRLMRRIRFTFLVNYHSAAELLLYPFGWQVDTETYDDPIFEALTGTDGPDPTTGTDDDSAVPGYDPDVAADLYTTNGETTDHAYESYGILAWTPELDVAPGSTGGGVFEFPDDEAQIQAVFAKNLPFALNVATSAEDPDNPRASSQNTTADYQVKATPDFEVDAFDRSYGDPQAVQANVRRSLGAVRLRYRINGGRLRTALAAEFAGGERYGDVRGVYYRRVRGTVTGTNVGDRVTAWFEAGGKRSASFTYEAVHENPATRVLVLAAEDYTGNSPQGPYAGPRYLALYQAALAANGLDSAAYDIDAQGRRAPDPLAVLGHFDAVVWYTGDDVIPREPTQPGGTSSRLVKDVELSLRDYLNEGGRLLHPSRNSGYVYFHGTSFPFPPAQGAPKPPSNDFFQYWLGVYEYESGLDTEQFAGVPVVATGPPFTFGTLTPDSSEGKNPSQFRTTSSFLDPDQFPQFTSVANSKYVPTGPDRYSPFSGTGQAFAAYTPNTWKRLSRSIAVPAETTTLDMQISYNTEADYDYAFVEVRAADGRWTTLADRNGHTSSTIPPSSSCADGWNATHPFISNYQTKNPDGTCSPTGANGGQWHAFSGNSGGWQAVSFDLSPYAGQTVEVAISYVTDPAVTGTGVQIDDVRLVTNGAPTLLADFEAEGLGGFTAGTAEGSPATTVNWVRAGRLDFPGDEAAGVTTSDTITLGFGLEQLTQNERETVMGQAMTYLLREDDTPPTVPASGRPTPAPAPTP